MKYLNREAGETRSRTAVLLVNLGTPEAPTTSAVRRYLKEFLWDPRLVELPRPLWWLILNAFVLRFRPSRSAKAYQSVWTEAGSPLLLTTRSLTEKIAARLQSEDILVKFAMRYGSPSIEQVMDKLNDQSVDRLIVLPLYPQYSATTTASVLDGVMQVLQRWRCVPELLMIRQYYTAEQYISALAVSVREHVEKHGEPDRFVLSFHGIPKSYADRGDPYPLQCMQTAELLAQKLGWSDDQWQLTFQSRFGREEWLRPYTDETLAGLPSSGVKKLAVLCPGFAADCLETLEEIDEENREIFLESGGDSFHYIPALNDSDAHVNCLIQQIESRL